MVRFSIAVTYDILSNYHPPTHHAPTISPIEKSFWKSIAPSKLLIFSWKLLQDRFPTCLQLQKQISQACYMKNFLEDCNNLFLRCLFSHKLWLAGLGWMGLSFAIPCTIHDLYVQLGDCIRIKKSKAVKHIFWYATVWCIWLLRNRIIFNEGRAKFMGILTHIKALSWQWILYKKGLILV